MAINLSRNTRLWVSTTDGVGGNPANNNSNTFEIPIQEGYSLAQSVSSSDISVSEAGPTPIRGSKRFNDSLEPVEWSFSTYITPYVGDATAAGGKILLVDALLWQALAVKRGVAVDFEDVTKTVHGDADSFNIAFTENSGHVLTELFLFFKIDNTFYKVKGAQVSSAEISVDIEDIAMVNWSGQATEIETLSTAPAWAANPASEGYNSAGVFVGYVPIPVNKQYILNKLTTMTMNAPDIAPSSANAKYNIPITGASVSINNNITFVTPNTLAEVDKPIGSFTGSFEVTGSIDAYLRTSVGANGNTVPYSSADLLSHMTSSSGLKKVTNATEVAIQLGGTEPGKPSFKITMPAVHLAVPNFNIEDVISTSIEFKAISTSTDLVSGSELSIEARVANP